jgi:HEAT repeat protein
LRKLLVCATLLLFAASGHASGQENGERVSGHEAGQDAAKEETPPLVRLGDVRDEAARLLKSQGNRERAWGAYLAGTHGLKEHAPALVELLADPNLAGGGWEESVVRQAALDALIRLDAEVPAEKLLPLYQSSPDEVVILLARSPEQNREALLPLFVEETPTARWLAVGNLLAESRAPGFAARLLRELKIEASLYVYDREGGHNYGLGGGDGASCGCGGGGSGGGEFPPVSYYVLTDTAGRGATVAAPGRHVVYYVRRSFPCPCSGTYDFERDSLRAEYLAGLLDTTEEDLKLDARPLREIVCKDAAECRRAVVAVRDEIEQSYAALLSRLLEVNLLDAAETAELRPDITLDITDSREAKSFPLPRKLRRVKIILSGVDDDAPSSPDGPTPGEPNQGPTP